ncbi:MAG: hypothetical protein ACI936_002677 [Paraglaciecola sp.]|jgi:hypothetical protein
MNNEHTKVTDLSAEQQTAVVDAKAVLASKQDVLMAIGQIQAFDFINKLTTVGSLKSLSEIKESKAYKGLTYKDENGELTTVGSWEECCKHFLGSSKSTIDERLMNLNTFGNEFFEAAQKIGLGNKDLRKLRQLPEESQQLIINSEAVDLSDKESVKELIEDLNFKQVIEKAELQKQVDDANQTVAAVRENSDQTQQELNKIKEIEAKRRFSQEPWKTQTIDNVTAMMHAKVAIQQGINQLGDVFDNLKNDESLDDKAIDLIARSLLSEAQAAHALVNNFTNELFGVLGGKYRPDVSAEDTFYDLKYEDAPAEQSLVE